MTDVYSLPAGSYSLDDLAAAVAGALPGDDPGREVRVMKAVRNQRITTGYGGNGGPTPTPQNTRANSMRVRANRDGFAARFGAIEQRLANLEY